MKRGVDRIGISVTRIDALQTIAAYTEMAWGQCPRLSPYFRAWGADGIVILDAQALIAAYL